VEAGGAVEIVVGSPAGVSSGSPNQTGKQNRGGWFGVELTSDAHQGCLVVRLIGGRLRIRCQNGDVNR